jgi:hypothetical protein
LPKQLELVLGSEIFIAKELLPPALRNRLIRLAAFQNPEFYRAQALRRPTYDTPRIVGRARDYPHSLGLPRGCLDDLLQLLSDLKISWVLRDDRFSGNPLNVAFHGELRQEQRVAAETMLAQETGVLSATTAFGKTVVGAWLIAKRAVNTLVLVHRRQLQEQWIERLSKFLGVPSNTIGRGHWFIAAVVRPLPHPRTFSRSFEPAHHFVSQPRARTDLGTVRCDQFGLTSFSASIGTSSFSCLRVPKLFTK